MIAPVRGVARLLDRVPARWQFAVFLALTVVITLALTVISYSLYVISGTSQLDLSRPGYKQALSEVAPSDTDDYNYSSTGPLDKNALDEFKTKYDALTSKTRSAGVFDPNALSDDQLNLTNSSVVGPQ